MKHFILNIGLPTLFGRISSGHLPIKLWAWTMSIQREKMSMVLVYISFPYNVLVYFLEGKVHEESKLEIMINVGKSHLHKQLQNK